MSKKARYSIITEQNQKHPFDKKITFDEENVRLTNRPITKDYGFMVIPESKTPFPRYASPVDAVDLFDRLQETLKRVNNEESQQSVSRNLYAQKSSMSVDNDEDNDEIDAVHRKELFYIKRKQFDQSEYIIAKQKIMSSEICEPGPSIGDNWRIAEKSDFLTIQSHPSIFKTFLNRHSLPSRISLVNRETFIEIAEQMVRSSQIAHKTRRKKHHQK